MKTEVFSGIEVIFYKEGTKVIAGFPKRPRIVSAPTKQEAFVKMKQVINGLHPVVLKTYKKYPKIMHELEEM